jgi:hypothetical protein
MREFNLRATPVGKISLGIDGFDEYLKVEDTNRDELDPERVDTMFRDYYFHETYQEAGGYFCKSYAFLKEYPDDTHGTLIIHHRYDV